MATAITARSAENRRYVRTLLRKRQPEFSAALELAVELVARETHPLSCVPVAIWLSGAVISR
jgi:hypothetical protein